MDDDDGGNKFAYLLQPIKDLEQNFAVDIVKLLDDYKQQLADVAEREQFQIDNAHRFNFAEAAVLIQGSTCVFGRKVDHLYSQAMHFFDSLQAVKKKKKPEATGDEDEGMGMDDDDGGEGSSTDAFNPMDLQDFTKIKTCDPMQLVAKRRVKGDITTISVMPMSLMPLSDFEKCNVPIYAKSNNKDIIGKKDDFKINNGYMAKSGAVLLDLKNVELENDFASDEFMLMAVAPPPKKPESGADGDADSGRGSPEPDENVMPIGDAVMMDGRASNVEYERRATMGLSTTNLGRPSTVLLTNKPRDSLDDSDFGGGGNAFEDMMDIDLPAPVQREPWETADGEIEMDPTEALVIDLFDDVKWRRKASKKLNDPPPALPIVQRKKKAEAKQDMRVKTMSTLTYINDHFYRKSKKLPSNVGKDWQVESLFLYIRAQQKKMSSKKREERLLARQQHQQQQTTVPTSSAGTQSQKTLDPRRTLVGANLDDLDDYDDFAGGAYDEDEIMGDNVQRQAAAGNKDALLFADIVDDELNNSINIPSMYLGRQPKDMNADHMDGMDLDEPLGDRPHSGMSVHDVLEFYMKKYWSSAEEASTRIGARVQEWETKMLPLLEVEETRKEFDIHEYGTEMLQLFEKEQQQTGLEQLLVGRKDYEISRYFLSCLMLTNTYNVQVVDDGEPNTMAVKLLKRDRHHEVFNQDGAL